METSELLSELGARTSKSEERGLSFIRDSDLLIFSPGISTGGFAEIRMAMENPKRKIIATTIDTKGLEFADNVINQAGLSDQIETKIEDLTSNWSYPENYFNFIYSRLVLHYLSSQDLDLVLANFKKSLKPGGEIFCVVRSDKNIDRNDPEVNYDPKTKLTTEPYRDANGVVVGRGTRYFHTPESIAEHFEKAGLVVEHTMEYQEQLFKDFMRKEVAPKLDHVIEVMVTKPIR